MRLLLAALATASTLALLAPSALAQSPPGGRVSRTGPASGQVPKIVLYTMGKGALVWEKFGHAALCVEYPPGDRRSRCYNYGTTDFTKPVSVGWGFLRGEGEFWVGVTTPRHMISRYEAFDRTLWRQVIPLPEDKVRWLEAALAENALPENRFYTYHHYHDNCTTRIRDFIDQATGGALRRDTQSRPGPSFREYSRKGFSQDAWLLVLSDFLLGRGADDVPDLWQAMFLPRYLRQVVRDRLGAEPIIVYQRQGPQLTEGDASSGGWIVLLAIAIALPLFLTRWRGRYERAGLAVTASLLFLVALLPWFLAVVTAVQEFRYNEILLLVVPTDIALIWLRPAHRVIYARIRLLVILLASVLRVAGVFVQPIWAPALVAFLPMLILADPLAIMGIRQRQRDVEPQAAASRGQDAADHETHRARKPAAGRSRRKGQNKRKRKRG